MADADARVGLADLGTVDGVSGHVGAALDQRVDAFVETGHRHHPHVLPREAGARELAEDVVPDAGLAGYSPVTRLPLPAWIVFNGQSRRTTRPTHNGNAGLPRPHPGG